MFRGSDKETAIHQAGATAVAGPKDKSRSLTPVPDKVRRDRVPFERLRACGMTALFWPELKMGLNDHKKPHAQKASMGHP
jgi:hypothetical protein